MDASVTRQVSKRIRSYPDYMMIKVRILLVILAASICASAFAQSGYVYTQELVDGYVSSRSIFVCSDNSVVVLGNVDDTSFSYDYYLSITKLDPSGNLLWRQWMGGAGILLTITGVDIDANDTVSFITTVLALEQYIKLWSVDSSGNISLITAAPGIPNPKRVHFNKALRTPGNEIVAVGKTYTSDDELSACYYRFSATGDTLATAFYPVDAGSGYQIAEAYDLVLTDNGNLLVTCALSANLASILEIDPDGNIINRIDFSDMFVNVYSCLTIERNPNDSSFLIAGPFGEYPGTMVRVYRLFNNELTYLFAIDTAVVQWVSSMLAHSNGILISGSEYHCSLVNLSYTGELIWSWQQNGTNRCTYLVNGIGTHSTALLALDNFNCVYWAWGNGGFQVITKLLPNGQVPVEDQVQTPSVNRISAYPNPLKDHVIIKVTHDDSRVHNDIIDIFNIRGQLVRSLKLTNSETQWDGKDYTGETCPTGIYLIRSGKGSKQVHRISKIN